MGAYLSEPVVDKESAHGTNGRLDYGASSMQGWRVTQEDAHNCLLDFEKETSFFAVYDGHGGHEVAVYSAANLPQFLKDCETYKKGDFVEALKEAFMGFDAKLATPEVVAALKEIVGNKDEKHSDSEDEEENVRNLYEEAEMPLEQVMAKYQSDLNPNLKKMKGEKSPFVRGKKACTSEASGSGSSSGCSSSSMPAIGRSSSSSSGSGVSSSEVKSPEKVKLPEKEIEFVPESKNTNGDSENKSNISRESENGISKPDSAVDTDEKSVSETKKEDKTESTETEVIAKSPAKKVEALNGDVAAEEEKRPSEAGENVTSSVVRENGDGSPPYEGKGKGKAKMVKPEETNTKNNHFMALRRHAANALYKALLGPQDKTDSDSDSDDDENFEGAPESSDDDADEDEEGKENAVADEEGDDDDEDEEDDDDDDDDDDSMVDDEEDEDDDFTMKMTEEPGSDSGCTAVVALLRGCDLYVANAGDSRCIVCRKGEAVEMSLDHKPEDQPESDRIVKAGGKVTADGRVNGGLNLSRALGDHAYKLNTELPPHEQMITAMPDVRTLTINPEEDEFMVLACDGIWNFMTNQEVCDFVRPRIEEGKDKLSTICEALFDHCLAPNTHGDGTGCDNMTAVIVKFHPSLAATADSKSTKRLASPVREEESTKRAKTDEPLPV